MYHELSKISSTQQSVEQFPAVLTAILCIGVAALLFTIFNNQNSSPTIEQLTAEYPEKLKEKIAELPETIQEKLVVPTDLPSDSYHVQFLYENVPINDPKWRDYIFIYWGKSELSSHAN